MALPMTEYQKYLAARMRGQVSPDYGAMPPHVFQNNESKQAMQVGSRMSPTPSGMATSGFAPIERGIPDYVADKNEGSIEGRQRISDNQREYAKSLRGSAMPEGREVGPLDVYMAPNWAESLAGAGKQAIGGYLTGKANREDASIDEARQLEKALAFEKAQEAEDYKRGREAGADSRAEAGAELAAANAQRTLNRDKVLDGRWEAEEEYKKKLAGAETEEEKAALKEDKRRWDAEMAIKREDQAMEKERDRLEAYGATGGPFDSDTNLAISKLGSAGEREGARGDLLTLQTLESTFADAEALLADGQSWSGGAADVGIGTAGVFGQTAQNMATEAAFNDDELQMRGDMANFVEQFKRDRTGANLTEMEQKLSADWNPSAPGISSAQSLSRARALADYMKQKLEIKGIPTGPRGAVTITTDEEFAKLAPGAEYIDPDDGKRYRKPE